MRASDAAKDINTCRNNFFKTTEIQKLLLNWLWQFFF